MNRTYILVAIQSGKPQWYHLSGLTKSAVIAEWLFDYCGWRQQVGELPDVIHNYSDEWNCEFMNRHESTVLGGMLCDN